jgi:hypothetical protein
MKHIAALPHPIGNETGPIFATKRIQERGSLRLISRVPELSQYVVLVPVRQMSGFRDEFFMSQEFIE